MRGSTRSIVIALWILMFSGLSFSAMAENSSKHQDPAKSVQKTGTKSKTGSKEGLSHAPLIEQHQLLSPGVDSAVDMIHGILGR